MWANGKIYYVLPDEIIPKSRPDAKLSGARVLPPTVFNFPFPNKRIWNINMPSYYWSDLLLTALKLTSRVVHYRQRPIINSERDQFELVWCGCQDVSKLGTVLNSENYVYSCLDLTVIPFVYSRRARRHVFHAIQFTLRGVLLNYQLAMSLLLRKVFNCHILKTRPPKHKLFCTGLFNRRVLHGPIWTSHVFNFSCLR